MKFVGTVGLFVWLGASMSAMGLEFSDVMYWIILIPIALFNTLQMSR